MSTFYLKSNDTSPSITATLRDAEGTLIDLTGASVNFHMYDADGTVKVDAAAVVADNDGVVRYDWIAADTDTVGVFYAEFEVTYADGTVETFPNTTNIKVKIRDDLA